MSLPRDCAPFSFAAELDRLVENGPPEPDDEEYRRFVRAFAELYPVSPWRKIGAERSRRERRRRTS